jgi:predicted outer membrane protein
MNIRRILMASFVLVTVPPGAISIVRAQGQGASAPATQTRPIEPQEFVRLAYSSASLQSQAARLAIGRDTRPEVKDYAASAADFRASLLQRLETFAKERGMPLPAMKEFEHQVIIENLEPLDALELSRRYAEIQVQALDREIGIYQAASRSPHQEIKEFAAQVLPELQQRLKGAQTMYDAIKP